MSKHSIVLFKGVDSNMLPYLVSGVIMFVLFFCGNHFWGIIKDKDGNKSVKLSLLCAFVAAVVGTGVSWLISNVLF